MNTYQRIVLVVGAVAFVIALLTSPRVILHNGTLHYYRSGSNRPSIVLLSNAAVRGIAVLGATVLLWFAVKGIRKEE